MLAEEQVIQKIRFAGPTGLRKAELRKEFPQPETEVLLEKLSKDGRIFIDKKGAAYYCWSKESYMQYLLNADPKFRLTYEAIHSLEQTVRTSGDQLLLSISEISLRPPQAASGNDSSQQSSEGKNTNEEAEITPDSFTRDFDEAVAKFSSSIGWVEFGKIRSDICKNYNLDNDKFYSLVAHLMMKHPEKYELSSGGHEGLTIRGMLHGFVRRI